MTIFLIIIILSIGILLLPYWIVPSNPFPQPSGRWQVGKSYLAWDTMDLSGIIAKVWYPTKVTPQANIPYLEHNIVRSIPGMSGINLFYRVLASRLFLGRVTVPASIDPTLDRVEGGFPLVLFSPGFGSISSLDTFHILELASHGFIVIGIDHPGSSAITILADGSSIEYERIDLNLLEKDPDRFYLNIGERTIEQGYNISLVLDKAIELNSTTDSFLSDAIDPNKIFAAGHSAGGAASFMSCGQDGRITKAVNLDGVFINSIDTDYTGKELLLIKHDRSPPQNRKLLSSYESWIARDKMEIDRLRDKANLQRLTFEKSKHFAFCDLAVIIDPLINKTFKLFGADAGTKLSLKTSRTIIDFFNIYQHPK